MLSVVIVVIVLLICLLVVLLLTAVLLILSLIHISLPYGHGEKSVYIVSGFMRLTREEAFAIRYHMGFSGIEDRNSIGKAFEMFPLALDVYKRQE